MVRPRIFPASFLVEQLALAPESFYLPSEIPVDLEFGYETPPWLEHETQPIHGNADYYNGGFRVRYPAEYDHDRENTMEVFGWPDPWDPCPMGYFQIEEDYVPPAVAEEPLERRPPKAKVVPPELQPTFLPMARIALWEIAQRPKKRIMGQHRVRQSTKLRKLRKTQRVMQ